MVNLAKPLLSFKSAVLCFADVSQLSHLFLETSKAGFPAGGFFHWVKCNLVSYGKELGIPGKASEYMFVTRGGNARDYGELQGRPKFYLQNAASGKQVNTDEILVTDLWQAQSPIGKRMVDNKVFRMSEKPVTSVMYFITTYVCYR